MFKCLNDKGFTLIELVVSMGIFTLIVGSSIGLFASGLKIQRTSLAEQEMLSQVSYLMEYMSRAIRMVKKDMSDLCTGEPKLNYSFTGDSSSGCLNFRNYKDECQSFCLIGGKMVDGGINLTSAGLDILSFDVDLTGQTQNDNQQPSVAISLDVQGREGSKIKIQTTISQRNLDIKK